jgi:iron-sulfur cluster assembly accessory protein
VREILDSQEPKPAGLRIAVVGGGCSGFSYSMAFENQPNMLDKTYSFNGLKVFVDQASLLYLDGAEVDYVETLEGSGFKFSNPQVKSTCGCGSSFSVVHYPGLAGHPGHAIAARQMSGFGGMLSMQLRGGRERAMQVAASVRLFTRATSLGGTHSLIEHRASVEGPNTRTPQNLLRISVGLENAEDLIGDLEQALG